MIKRLYVHNFRCLENFELLLKDLPSALLIGDNGTGKSTVAAVLQTLQSIGRGVNRVGDLVQAKDFTRGRSDVPVRFQIDVELDGDVYEYTLAFELPERFQELRVAEEQLTVAGTPIYSRDKAQVNLRAGQRNREAQFLLDWHLVALPVIQQQSEADPLSRFKTWLARTIILAPIPSLMTGDSSGETLAPKRDGSNFAEWFTGLLSQFPAAYSEIEQYLRTVMPDIRDLINEQAGKDSKSMIVRFQKRDANLSVYFTDLSDGEKCFFLCATLLAANKFYGPLFCFWDEPDSYLSLRDVGDLVTRLRRSFTPNGQILVTSHNPEAIRRFSNENTLHLSRKSHLEPTVVRPLSDLSIAGDLVDALIRGDVNGEM